MRERGRLDEALTACDSLIQLNPALGDSHAMKGLCLIDAKRAPEAEAEFRQALELAECATNRFYLCLALEAQERLDDAHKEYATAVDLYPQDPSLAVGYLSLLVQQGRGADAATAYANLRDGGLRLDDDALAWLGEEAQAQGQAGLAGLAYGDWAARGSNDPDQVQGYFTYMLAQSQIDGIRGYLAGAVARLEGPEYEEVLQRLMVACVQAQRLAEGIELFTGEVATRPSAEAYLALSVLLSQSGETAGALTQVRAGLERFPEHYYLRVRLAVLTQRVEGAQAALDTVADVLEHPELDAAGYKVCCEIFSGVGDLASATSTAREGLGRYPADAELLQQLVEGLYAQSDYAGVLVVLGDPAYAQAAYPKRDELAGRCELALLSYARAVADFSRAAAAQPQDAGLWALLGEAQYFLGTFQDARESLTRAMNLDDGLPAAQLWLGWALLELGEPAGAEQALAGAAHLPAASQTDLAWCALGRAKLALLRGERETAQAALAEAAHYGVADVRFQTKLQELTAQAGP